MKRVNVYLMFLSLLVANPILAGKYAILVNSCSSSWAQLDLQYVYTVLKNYYQYTDSNIYVLYHNGEYFDLDSDGNDDVDYGCTESNLNTVFTSLHSQASAGDIVFFYATGHGGILPVADTHIVYIKLNDPDTLYDYELKQKFSSFVEGVKKVSMINTCRGGGFHENLDSLDYSFVATACKYSESAWHCDTMGNEFTYQWYLGITSDSADYDNDSVITIGESYRYAKENDRFSDNNSYNDPCKMGNHEHPRLTGTEPCFWYRYWSLGNQFSNNAFVIATIECCIIEQASMEPWWGGRTCIPPVGMFVVVLGKNSRTFEVGALLENAGNEPSEPSIIHFYYHQPTIMIHPDTSWVWMNTLTIPPLDPLDTVTVGPFTYEIPGANDFGEPYWTFAAKVEDNSPPGSGWLLEDPQTTAYNVWTITAGVNEPKTIHFYASNPIEDTAKIVLNLDLSQYPANWYANLEPMPGETILLMPLEERACTLTLMPSDISSDSGKVIVTEELFDKTAHPCESCEDSLCSGPIRTTGGVTVLLYIQPSPLFSENFDDCDISDWDVHTEAGTFETQSTYYVSPPCALHMASQDTGYAYGTTPSFPLNTDTTYTLKTNFMIPNTNNHWFLVLDNHQVHLVIDHTNELKAWQGYEHGGTKLIQNLNTNQWYTITCNARPEVDSYDVYVDEEYKASAHFLDTTAFSYLRVGDIHTGSYDHGEGYWDDIEVYGSLLLTFFIRGDVNADGSIGYSDLVFLANYLFAGGITPSCMDAADVNDDGQVAYSDLVYLGSYLFSGGPEPPQPFPNCGVDSTNDDLGCESFPPCE